MHDDPLSHSPVYTILGGDEMGEEQRYDTRNEEMKYDLFFIVS